MRFLHSLISNKKGFTLVELIIGITIFTIGMTGVLALLQSTISSSFISRHEIVAANLLREQIELIRNLRNTNVRSFIDWDTAIIDGTTPSHLTGGTFIIENNFSHTGITFNDGKISGSPIFIKKIEFPSDSSLEEIFDATRLYLDNQGRFVHSGTLDLATQTVDRILRTILEDNGHQEQTYLDNPTNYASYIIIKPITIPGKGEIKRGDKYQGYIVDARVIVKSRGFREYDLTTIITDWNK